MPIYPPRNEPIKKKDQLLQRTLELQHAINNNFTPHKLNKAAEKYRLAQLSLLKAKVHEFKEWDYQKKPQLSDINTLEKNILIWIDKPVEEIINQLKI